MNRWGEDILPEEAAYAMEDNAYQQDRQCRFALRGGSGFLAGRRGWTLKTSSPDPRRTFVAVRVERRVWGQRDPVGTWISHKPHDDAVMADLSALNDPICRQRRSVNYTMALGPISGYFTGRATLCGASRVDIAA